MMSTKDTLIAARAKIEQGWTQGALARDKNGRSTVAYGSDAVCWCAVGSILAVDYLDTANAQRYLEEFVPRGLIAVWNDKLTRTKQDVLALYDKAIASCL